MSHRDGYPRNRHVMQKHEKKSLKWMGQSTSLQHTDMFSTQQSFMIEMSMPYRKQKKLANTIKSFSKCWTKISWL